MTRAEALHILEDRSRKFINTQSIQWKLNFSLWTSIAFAIYYNAKLGELDTDIPSFNYFAEHYGYFLYILCTVVFITHLFFCRSVQWSLDSDKAVTEDIIKQLNTDEVNVIVDVTKKPSEFLPFKWMAIQLTITIVLLFILCNSPA